MAVVVFDMGALESWKLRLRELANAGDGCKEHVLSCLDALEHLGRTAEHDSVLPVPRNNLETDLAVINAAPYTRVSTGTQLWTVHPIHYTHHVLNKMMRERQVQRLTRRLGNLAADLHSVAHDMWKVLQASCIRQTSTASQRLSDVTRVTTLDRPASVATAPGSMNGASPALSPSTCRTLRSLFGRFPDFEADVLLHGSSLNASSEATTETSATPPHARKQVDASVQTPPEFTAESTAVDTPRERLLFLCRRCRQDGRAGYQVDKNRMQLKQTHDIVASVERTEPPPSLKSPTLQCTVSRGARPPLPQIGGTRRPRW
ncbi:hypothetical protein LDHU3_34.3130:CDS1 [Leishmania donovani]|uniref:Hypothetical_protein n=1 Tax=Leishmania donovani TaxID=5661 RepID=A0A6J8FQ71_LEIDO|nr:hypothetical protein LDHU3_34.3130:CDS1 [Leishmania donovani]VDZ48382.1 hypothetical_protein [Leishmania donovani]